MLTNTSTFSAGLTVHPSRPTDEPFLEELYRSARPDLQLINGDAELIDELIKLQHQVLQQGAGNHFPNAMHFVIEKTQDRIGGLIVDFGHNEVRVIYLAFIPAARRKGYGNVVLQGLQKAAESARCPVAVVVWRNNPQAKRLYLELGFQVEESQPMAERLVWFPGSTP